MTYLKEFEKKREKYLDLIDKISLSPKDLKVFAAGLMVSLEETEEILRNADEALRDGHTALNVFSADVSKMSTEMKSAFLQMMAENQSRVAAALLAGMSAQKKSLAKRGAQEKLKRDPRQSDKQIVLELWKDWKQHPAKYRSKAEFARKMLEKVENLKSHRKIEDWCRQWEKSEPCK